MKGTIRRATPDDALAIHQLHTRSVRGLCSADYSADIIEGWLEGRSPEGYTGIAKGEMYVYEQAGKIVGWSHMRPGMIVGLFVDPEYARKGIGRALFEHGLPIVRRDHPEAIRFEATLTAAPFYEKCGCIELERSSIKKNTVDVPTVVMLLPRQEPTSR